jgi:hypothetical protein
MCVADSCEEADTMDFSVICPNDGPVEVGLESISTIIFRGVESVVIIVACPKCGAEIQVTLQIPDMFIASNDDAPFSAEVELLEYQPFARRLEHVEPPSPGEQRRIDRYCEYFRRQLASAEDVDAVLAEIDSQQRKP